MMLRKVYLHGALARFGKMHSFHIDSPHEAISALENQCDGFTEAIRQGRFSMAKGAADQLKALDGAMLFAPFTEPDLHIWPDMAGHGKGDGKMLLGLTLLGLSFIPGVQAGIGSQFARLGTTLGGAGLGEAAGFFGSKLLGGAATWLILSSASDSLAPQIHAPAGIVESDVIAASASSGEGTPIPLVYGMVRVTEPPVISAGLSVAIEKLT
jgi:predicted phage tail protein